MLTTSHFWRALSGDPIYCTHTQSKPCAAVGQVPFRPHNASSTNTLNKQATTITPLVVCSAPTHTLARWRVRASTLYKCANVTRTRTRLHLNLWALLNHQRVVLLAARRVLQTQIHTQTHTQTDTSGIFIVERHVVDDDDDQHDEYDDDCLTLWCLGIRARTHARARFR